MILVNSSLKHCLEAMTLMLLTVYIELWLQVFGLKKLLASIFNAGVLRTKSDVKDGAFCKIN